MLLQQCEHAGDLVDVSDGFDIDDELTAEAGNFRACMSASRSRECLPVDSVSGGVLGRLKGGHARPKGLASRFVRGFGSISRVDYPKNKLFGRVFSRTPEYRLFLLQNSPALTSEYEGCMF